MSNKLLHHYIISYPTLQMPTLYFSKAFIFLGCTGICHAVTNAYLSTDWSVCGLCTLGFEVDVNLSSMESIQASKTKA